MKNQTGDESEVLALNEKTNKQYDNTINKKALFDETETARDKYGGFR
ncbi:hypothetical protein ACFL9S_04745 [Erwinia sp. AnSW2-5]